jgi:hypothetical protein
MHFTPMRAGLVVGAPLASAEVLDTHRIPALLALEAGSDRRNKAENAGRE